MRFKIDENLPDEVAAMLRQGGHDASTVLQQELGGRADADIASICQRERRALLTLDADFADIRTYPPKCYPGLIVLRLHRQDKPHVLGLIARLMEQLLQETLDGRLWIVEEARLRIRG
jgi:predicted nuclease of predicted toxin-antitoxin system